GELEGRERRRLSREQARLHLSRTRELALEPLPQRGVRQAQPPRAKEVLDAGVHLEFFRWRDDQLVDPRPRLGPPLPCTVAVRDEEEGKKDRVGRRLHRVDPPGATVERGLVD